jgi:hypothetical protein
MRVRAAAATAAGLLAFAPLAARATADAEAEAERWAGRYCTPFGCGGSAASVVSDAAGFAIAAAAIYLIRRRRA